MFFSSDTFFKNKGYDAFTFENPKIQKHYACLQALALFKDETGFNEKDDDALFPDVEGEFYLFFLNTLLLVNIGY